MAGIGDYKKGGKFTLRSGNSPLEFKNMGSSPVKKGTHTDYQTHNKAGKEHYHSTKDVVTDQGSYTELRINYPGKDKENKDLGGSYGITDKVNVKKKGAKEGEKSEKSEKSRKALIKQQKDEAKRRALKEQIKKEAAGESPAKDKRTWTAAEFNDPLNPWISKDRHNKDHKRKGDWSDESHGSEKKKTNGSEKKKTNGSEKKKTNGSEKKKTKEETEE